MTSNQEKSAMLNRFTRALRGIIDGAERDGIQFGIIETFDHTLYVEATWGDEGDQRFRIVVQPEATA